jgi:hypothetical protein
MAEIEFKPCPFYGSKPFVWRTNNRTYIECPNLTADNHRIKKQPRHGTGGVTMARLIDADKLLEIYKKWIPQLSSKEDEGDRRGVETCISVLEDMQTVDAVPVIRCRECKYHNKPPCPMRLSFNWTEDNDFCSYGERKDGDSNG